MGHSVKTCIESIPIFRRKKNDYDLTQIKLIVYTICEEKEEEEKRDK